MSGQSVLYDGDPLKDLGLSAFLDRCDAAGGVRLEVELYFFVNCVICLTDIPFEAHSYCCCCCKVATLTVHLAFALQYVLNRTCGLKYAAS
jgi:hypothetical protein